MIANLALAVLSMQAHLSTVEHNRRPTAPSAPFSIPGPCRRPTLGLGSLARRTGPVPYARQAYAPLWYRQDRLTPAGWALVRQLQFVDQRGLLLADYDGPRLEQLTTELDRERPVSARNIASLEVALSIAAARLASDLQQGRVDPGQLGRNLDVSRPAFDAAEAVAALATAPDVAAALDALEPPFRHYALLKTALARYRMLARQPELAKLPALPHLSVHPGENYAGAPALRRLLAAFADLPAMPVGQDVASACAGSVPHRRACALSVASRTRCRRNPRSADLCALTTPIEARVRQIELSLERLRWLPAKLETPPIIVNIPYSACLPFAQRETTRKTSCRWT